MELKVLSLVYCSLTVFLLCKNCKPANISCVPHAAKLCWPKYILVPSPLYVTKWIFQEGVGHAKKYCDTLNCQFTCNIHFNRAFKWGAVWTYSLSCISIKSKQSYYNHSAYFWSLSAGSTSDFCQQFYHNRLRPKR